MIEITNIDDPRVADYQRMKKNVLSDYCVADGKKVVLKAIESDWELISTFALKDHYQTLLSKPLGQTDCYYAGKALMEEVVGHRLHQGCMAILKRPKETAFDSLGEKIIALDGITQAENTGAIIRNGVGFDFTDYLIGENTCHPHIRRAIRASTGHIFSANTYQSKNLVNDLIKLKDKGYKIITSEISENTTPLFEFKFPKKYCIVIGSEGSGVSKKVSELADAKVFIPMANDVNSLNAACASAVICSYAKYS